MNLPPAPTPPSSTAYIIAEIGSNHNQDLDIALASIDASAAAGVDAVKFQLFRGKRHYSKFTPFFSAHPQHAVELLESLELPRDWIPRLKTHTEDLGMEFICSVTAGEDVDLLIDHGVDKLKIPSFEIVDLPLLRHAARKAGTLLISTGMANMEEIEDAYQCCKEEGLEKLVLFQCASAYPSDPEIMNLRAIHTLALAFPDALIGLSDHTLGTVISPAAVAMGARVIEKHFTLDKAMDGPDHHFAMNPEEMTQLVQNIREVEKAMGNGQKLAPYPQETEYYAKARRSIHARRDIPKGQPITPEDLIIKRPGYGIKPKFMDIIQNRKAKVDIQADEWITWDKI